MRKSILTRSGSSSRAGLALGALVGLALFASPPARAVSISLGNAGVYAVGAPANGGQVVLKGDGTQVNGDLIARDLIKIQNGATLDGKLVRVAGTDVRISDASINGSILTASAAAASQTKADLDAALMQIAGLTATQTLGKINSNTTITGNGGLNVIDIKSIRLTDSKAITFSGGPNDIFVVRVRDEVKMDQMSRISAGSVGSDKVLFTVGRDLHQRGSSVSDGTYIALSKDIDVSGGTHNGAFLVAEGDRITISNGATVNFVAFVPEPGALALLGLGLGGLGVQGRRRRA